MINEHLKPLIKVQCNDFFLLEFTSCKTEQPLRGMKLQEHEVQKDYSIQEMFRKNLQIKGVR